MNQNTNVWDFASFWQNFREPARPNASELNWLAHYVKPGQHVLILGSTPEYRDLCARVGAIATIIDFNSNTYNNLTKLMTESSAAERFICQDWLDLNSVAEYDLILGDHVINLLTWENLPKLFQNIKRALRTVNSKWITRIIRLDNLPRRSLPEIITNYRLHYREQDFFSTTFYDLFKFSMDASDYSISLDRLWQILHEAYQAGILSQREFAVYDQMGIKTVVAKGYCYNLHALEELMQRFFMIQGIAHGDLYYKDQTYFYLLTNLV